MNNLQALIVIWQGQIAVGLEWVPSVSGLDLAATADKVLEEKREMGMICDNCGVYLVNGKRLVWVGDRS